MCQCKMELADAITDFLCPIRERRAVLQAEKGKVMEILMQGAQKARAFARKTMDQVRDVLWHGRP